MKTVSVLFGLLGALLLTHPMLADTVLSVTNGGGSYSTSAISFYDANGTFLVLNGGASSVQITYQDGTKLSFPYSQTVSGLTISGTWTGLDEAGYAYTATATEYLVQTRHSGSGRGGGYRTTVTTSLSHGSISYDYPIFPLTSPSVTANATSDAVSSTATLTWSAAVGGVAPYTYSILDENNVNVADTTGFSVTLTGLTPSTDTYYTLVVTDSAGHMASTTFDIVTPDATLNTEYTVNLTGEYVTATWSASPTAVSYSVFYYDAINGIWVDGADTTGTSARISGWGENTYIYVYVAAYDSDGVETDYDLQFVLLQPADN